MSKSLLHVLAQRLTRSHPSRTSHQHSSSPSWMHLDVGEVDRTSHIHSPAVSVQSHAPSEDVSSCMGHAASTSGMTMYQTRRRHRSGARFQNCARGSKTRTMVSFQQCRKIRQKQSFGGRLSLSPSPSLKQAGNTCGTCRGIVDRAMATPSAHKRMTGKYMPDVFGGLLAKATNNLGLRGRVLGTKLGPRCDVTKHPCSHQHSTGRLRRKICRRNDFTSATTHFVLSQKLFSPMLPSECNTRVNRGCRSAENPDSCGTALGLGPGVFFFYVFGSPFRKRTLFLVEDVDSQDVHRIAPKCVWTSQVSGQKHVHPKASASRSEFDSSRDHTRPLRLSFALAMILTMNTRRLQRTHPWSGMGSSLEASKDIGNGVTDFALTCGSETVVDAVCTAVVGSARTGRVHVAGSDRKDRSSDVCYVGDTAVMF